MRGKKVDDNVEVDESAVSSSQQNDYIEEINHNPTTKEMFSMVKDAFDVISVFKKIWANRKAIGRKFNTLVFICGIAFSIIYLAYIIFSGALHSASLPLTICAYIVVGAYVGVSVALSIVKYVSNGAKTTTQKRFQLAKKIIRYLRSAVNIAMSIFAIYISTSMGENNVGTAINIVFIVFSIISLIVQVLPLLFGGIGGLARWLLAPTKIKLHFSDVILEWYTALTEDNRKNMNKVIKRVSKKHIEAIGMVIDTYLIPSLGAKYITTITSKQLAELRNSVPLEHIKVVEGTLNNVFAYAENCGYININPTTDLKMTGSIEGGVKATGKRILGAIFRRKKK